MERDAERLVGLGVEGLPPLLLLLVAFTELVCGEAGTLLLLDFWVLSEDEAGEVPAALAPGSFRGV